MEAFNSRSSLPCESTLFTGRQQELNDLNNYCCEGNDVLSYLILYGGSKMGKTSLLNQFSAKLPLHIEYCPVNFWLLPPDSTTLPDILTFLVEQISQKILPEAPISPITNTWGLQNFLKQQIQKLEIADKKKLLVCLEGLKNIPLELRNALAQTLRAIFNCRTEARFRELRRFMIILAGNVEVFELSQVRGSPLENICQFIYLSDLTLKETIALLKDNLNCSPEFAHKIYTITGGHVYFIHRIGELIQNAGIPLSPNQETEFFLQDIVEQILKDDTLLRLLKHSLSENDLWSSIDFLLAGTQPFERMATYKQKLEILGMAKNIDDKFCIRNQIIGTWIQLNFEAEMNESIPPNPTLKDVKCTILTERHAQLLQEYEGIGQRINMTTNPIEETRLKTQFKELSIEIETLENDLKELGCEGW